MIESSRAVGSRTAQGAPRTGRTRLAASLAFAVVTCGGAPAATEDKGTRDVKAYCAHIAVAASDARLAWQTGKLNELETRIKGRIQDLETKTAELRTWIEKRDQMERQAGEKLTGIYAKMRPETAATQISSLDDDMAAAVLSQLNPRQASAIFNELVPERAAKLASLIAAPAPTPDKKP